MDWKNNFQHFRKCFHFFAAPFLLNEGTDCLPQCGQNGDCVWCGTEGKCCRLNYVGGSCNGNEGGNGFHTCVRNGKLR